MTEAEETKFYQNLGRQIRAGTKPPELNRPIVCRECGPVWSMQPAAILSDSCFWCGNRFAGRPIPRPPISPEMQKILQEIGSFNRKEPVKKSAGFVGSKFL